MRKDMEQTDMLYALVYEYPDGHQEFKSRYPNRGVSVYRSKKMALSKAKQAPVIYTQDGEVVPRVVSFTRSEMVE